MSNNIDTGLLLYVMNLIVLGVVCILYCLFTFCVFCARDSFRPSDLNSFETSNPESVLSSPLEDPEEALSNVYVSASSGHLFPQHLPMNSHCQRHQPNVGRSLEQILTSVNDHSSFSHEISNEIPSSSFIHEQSSLFDNSDLMHAISRDDAPPSDDPPPPYECFQPPKYSCLY